jgi:tetratricopeptide (TPR) repeat protein
MTERTRIGLLLGLTGVVYANSLTNGFVFDDVYYILKNRLVTSLSLSALLQLTNNNVFRPVTMASFAFNWATSGAHPFLYHLLNLLLHAAVVILLYFVLQTLLESVPHAPTIAFAAALLFAVHPIHTEAVTSIVGRSELLATFLLLAAWLLHLRDKLIPALLCFLLALLSKESAMAFLPLVLAGDFARGKWKPLWRYLAVTGIAAAYLAIFWKIEGGRFGEVSISFVDNPLASLPAQLRILNALRIAWKYMGLLLYPAKLSYDYSYNAIALYASWKHAAFALAGAILLLALFFWTLWTRRSPWFLAGAIFLGSFAITANILIPTGTIMAERLTYLPSAGFCLLIALLWMPLAIRKPAAGWALLAVVVAALGTRTILRNRDWKNDFTLFSTGVQVSPGSARAHRNLADEFAARGQADAARSEYQAAIRIFPGYSEAIENYGLMEARLGHNEEARTLLEGALSTSTKGTTEYDFLEVNLASHLMQTGETEEAFRLLSDEINTWPGYALAWSNRSVIHYQRGNLAAARTDAETALRLDPGNLQAQAVLKQLGANNGARLP